MRIEKKSYGVGIMNIESSIHMSLSKSHIGFDGELSKFIEKFSVSFMIDMIQNRFQMLLAKSLFGGEIQWHDDQIASRIDNSSDRFRIIPIVEFGSRRNISWLEKHTPHRDRLFYLFEKSGLFFFDCSQITHWAKA
jgi:hypothetical protein